MRLAGNNLIKSPFDIPMMQLLIKPKDLSGKTLDIIANKLREWISDNNLPYSVWNYNEVKETLLSSKHFINIIFTIITVVIMVLCFFSLISSMSANIIE